MSDDLKFTLALIAFIVVLAILIVDHIDNLLRNLSEHIYNRYKALRMSLVYRSDILARMLGAIKSNGINIDVKIPSTKDIGNCITVRDLQQKNARLNVAEKKIGEVINDPELKDCKMLVILNRSLGKNDYNVTKNIDMYNENTYVYNHRIKYFPMNLIVRFDRSLPLGHEHFKNIKPGDE